MLVREVMTSPVITVSPRTTVRQAVHLLYTENVTAAPVVDDESGRLMGIVSEMDLLRDEFEADPRAFLRPVTAAPAPPPTTVGEVMTPKVETTAETADAGVLAEFMMATGIKSVPVLRDHELVGIVSRRDLLGVLAHGDDRIRDDVVTALADLAPGVPWRVTVRDGVVELHGAADEKDERIGEVIARTVPGVLRVHHRR